MRAIRILLFVFLMTTPFAMARHQPQIHAQLANSTGTAACTSNCTGIALTFAPVSQPFPNCSATVTTGCYAGVQVILAPPVGTGATVTLTPAQTGGPTSTGYVWHATGQLFAGTWTITSQAIGVGVPNGPVMTTTMTYAPACVTPPVTAAVSQ